MLKALRAPQIFTGEEWLTSAAILCDDDQIIDIISQTDIPNAVEQIALEEGFLAPALIDAQVYGAGGKLFSVYPEPETLQRMHEMFAAQGTCLFQPTLATNTLSVFKKAIDAVRQYRNAGGKGVHGLHLEGPWLNPVKAGAHVKDWMHEPTIEEAEALLAYGEGVITMITLAPEICSDAVIRLIQSSGVVVSAGHSNLRFEQAIDCFDKGIGAVTHLYNAMSPLHHREPGLVGACFCHPSVRASIIPDGHHVHFEAIRIAKQAMGSRLFVITDAVTDTAEGPYQHHLAGDQYECNGTLSGSAVSMIEGCRRLVEKCSIDKDEALRMCSLYPAEVLGISQQYGRVQKGFRASIIHVDANWGGRLL